MRLTTREVVTELVYGWDDEGTRRRGLLLLVLAQTTPGGGAGDDSRKTHSKVVGSPTPCDPSMFNLATEMHSLSRELEANLALLLGKWQPPRGGSFINTTRALYRVASLHEQAVRLHGDSWIVRDTERRLSSWRRRARIALGIDKRWLVWPTPCPECGNATLRQREDGTIICLRCQLVWDDPEWLGRVVAEVTEQVDG